MMTEILSKGTQVLVTTNNGGEIVGTLAHDYHPAYGIDLIWTVHHISPERIVKVQRIVPTEQPA